jgi:lipopolysaccharide/colanic/teichoic acid biosynthesis glycosyltransferase
MYNWGLSSEVPTLSSSDSALLEPRVTQTVCTRDHAVPRGVDAAIVRSSSYESVKRAIDLVLCGVLMVAAFPVFVVIATCIKLDSRGPVLFRQERIGRHRQPFQFTKFRTMHVDARSTYATLYDYRFDPDDLRQSFFKFADDPRLTRVGRWIRRTSLDELPNLVNVLRGDMSMVGPRPELPELLCYYRQAELCKFDVLPGVTGLAQVSGRNILRWGETNSYDVEYVHTRSTRLDIKILVRTVKAVIGMVGAL